MRGLLFLLAACAPRGTYVANVYTLDGSLVQEKCELAARDRCHIEPIRAVAGYEYPRNLYPYGPSGTVQPEPRPAVYVSPTP
jgi:hypothetical protein